MSIILPLGATEVLISGLTYKLVTAYGVDINKKILLKQEYDEAKRQYNILQTQCNFRVKLGQVS